MVFKTTCWMMLNEMLPWKIHLFRSHNVYGYCTSRRTVFWCDDPVEVSNQCSWGTDIVSLYHHFEVLFPMQNLVNNNNNSVKKREKFWYFKTFNSAYKYTVPFHSTMIGKFSLTNNTLLANTYSLMHVPIIIHSFTILCYLMAVFHTHSSLTITDSYNFSFNN